MSRFCSKCFEEVDEYHSCGFPDEDVHAQSDFIASNMGNNALLTVVALAPLMGIVFDLFLPLPSSLIHSILVSVLGSTVVAALWVAIKYEGKKSFKFYLKNLKNFAFTPLILKIFTTADSKKATGSWLGVIAFSSAIQIFLFTPGNSTYLESRITKQIDDASGANLRAECPSNIVYLYNKRIECRVNTGILKITVPARAQLSPLLGSADIKVSLV
jgi:hypothetical protein